VYPEYFLPLALLKPWPVGATLLGSPINVLPKAVKPAEPEAIQIWNGVVVFTLTVLIAVPVLPAISVAE
tara:strand:+ start:5665 stop:5871 length:207 start_codon:yes stop_codon:yes gene_type:complete